MSTRLYASILVVLFSFTIASCKKEEQATITIAGVVSDSAGSVSGASIAISVKEISGGTFSNTFSTFYSGTSASNGSYSHTFDSYNAIEYKIEVESPNRFDEELIINPEDLQKNATNTFNFNMRPQGWYRVNIRNSAPFDSTDLIQYQISTSQEPCPGCCHNLLELYSGDMVDTTTKCMTTGNTMVTASWVVTKNSIAQSYSDSVYCAIGDTGVLNINY